MTVLAACDDEARAPQTDGARTVIPVAVPASDAIKTARRFMARWEAIDPGDRPGVLEAADYCGAASLIAASGGRTRVVTRLHLPLSILLERNEGQRIYRDDRARTDLERMQVGSSDLLCSPSRWLADEAVRHWGLRTRPDVVPNPVDPSWLRPEAGRRRPGRPRLLYFGRIEYRKGVLVLAEALRRCFARGLRAEVAFIGGDTKWRGRSMRDTVLERIGEVPEGAAVRMLPAADRSQVRARIDGSDLVILPSLYENFAYACLESMCRAVPVLATSGSGFDDIIAAGHDGFLVPAGDPAELADEIMARSSDLEGLAKTGARARDAVATLVPDRILPDLIKRYASI